MALHTPYILGLHEHSVTTSTWADVSENSLYSLFVHHGQGRGLHQNFAWCSFFDFIQNFFPIEVFGEIILFNIQELEI